jgi:hypothetical protein
MYGCLGWYHSAIIFFPIEAAPFSSDDITLGKLEAPLLTPRIAPLAFRSEPSN